jgi:acyl-CoA dehydrogenase
MDFSFTDEQQSIIDLAHQILADACTQERLRAIEASDGPRFDRELWREVAKAGLVGVAIPEEFDGGGFGFFELALIIEQVGRTSPLSRPPSWAPSRSPGLEARSRSGSCSRGRPRAR